MDEDLIPIIGVGSGIAGGTYLLDLVIDKYLKLTKTPSTIIKISSKILVGRYLYRYGMLSQTPKQILSMSTGIGLITSIILDVARYYGFDSAIEKNLENKEHVKLCECN